MLRHGAKANGLKMDSEGWVEVRDILRLADCVKRGVTEDEIRFIVSTNDKQRYVLKDGRIRANQGHSIEVDLQLRKVTSAAEVPNGIAVHGTYLKAWHGGIKGQGLSKMGRQHIHFAVGKPGAGEVISGMRSTAEVLIYLDLEKCLQDGIPIFLSENNVVLSPGINGIIPTIYFKYVLGKNDKPFDSAFPNQPN
uniref:2'-phosphotransferase n=1 Tax=Arcella intermedia TaxID=1963864 RepID=A0A6B2LIR4_9EUKA